MNKQDNSTVYPSLSTEELKNISGGKRSNFWEVIFKPRITIKQ